ncbi:unnamed protein product [Acanthoscelides obtectus]|uniref:Uncharacterized protein n=1 Tax=Acanthoscelides obtectus TaxID=200917 RepID=A0A9P0Q1J0_ACAOB|nr:unnamed protein product [Acanthoscelides obtectus]CAK1672269.1 hypothetical protein AOBTE_LOCUS28753 [Acanthoscelides obtectus]
MSLAVRNSPAKVKMTVTESKTTEDAPADRHETLPIHQINPSYTVRVVCCVLFIFLTEIFLAHYVYRLINSEIRVDYLERHTFNQFFLNELRKDDFRNELRKVLCDFESRPKRSLKARVEANYLTDQAEEPQVEFFNPKIRGNLEEKDEEIIKKTGNKGAAPGGDSWIWVTSSSRIPVNN